MPVACRRTQGFSGTRFGGPVALSVDMFLHCEGEIRIVGLIVAGTADLEDYARVAFVPEADDIAEFRSALGDMVASRPVTGFTADSGEVHVAVGISLGWESASASVPRCMAGEAIAVVGFVLGCQ